MKINDDLKNRYLHSSERNVEQLTFFEYLAKLDIGHNSPAEHPYDIEVQPVEEDEDYWSGDYWDGPEGAPMHEVPPIIFETQEPHEVFMKRMLEESEEQTRDEIEMAVDPAHYKSIIPGYEYFDLMDYMLEGWKGSQGHALGNAYKYLMRLGKKDNSVQELGKAIWYLERLKKDLETNGKK